MVAGAVKPYLPNDAPAWYVAAGFGLYFAICIAVQPLPRKTRAFPETLTSSADDEKAPCAVNRAAKMIDDEQPWLTLATFESTARTTRDRTRIDPCPHLSHRVSASRILNAYRR